MNHLVEDKEEASGWLIPVEPQVEIEESEKTFEMIETVAEEHSSDSEEENNLQAVQELESVLVDKMCEVCGNFYQTFELVNAEPSKPLLSTCETCSYYISPPVGTIYNSCNLVQFSCDKCSKTFTRKDKLLVHKVTHSKIKPFSCDLCDRSYKRRDKLTEHLRLVHTEEEKHAKEKCMTCGTIDNIITINVGENEAECLKLCEACNLSRQEQMSKLNQNSSKGFQCDLCSRSFSRRDHAARHRLSHLNEKPFECYICKKSFNRNDRLLRHMKTHPGAKPFSCRVCSEAFSDREKLKMHLSSHQKSKWKAKQKIFQKEIKDKSKFQKPLATNKNDATSICEICGKTFKLLEELLTHQKIHFDDNPFKCKTCGLQFKEMLNLTKHMLTHSTEGKKYSCHLCAKTFKRKDKLQTHHVVHIDIKPYTCKHCNSSFKRKDKYTRHLKRVHKVTSDEDAIPVDNDMSQDESADRDITCSMCGLTFLCEDDLTEHKMVHYR